MLSLVVETTKSQFDASQILSFTSLWARYYFGRLGVILFYIDMNLPTLTQPGLSFDLSNQLCISTGLFNFMLDITKTREEIERSWAVILRDMELADTQEREIWV